jgi:hypothetical protein
MGDLSFPQQQVKNAIFWYMASQSGMNFAPFGEMHCFHFQDR